MTESETEDETIDRLEAALRRIAVSARADKQSDQRAAPHEPAVDRAALARALDMLIARLRTGLDAAGPALHGLE